MLNFFQTLFGGSSTRQQQQSEQHSQSQQSQQSQSTQNSQSGSFNLNPFTSILGGDLTDLAKSFASGMPQYGGPLAAGMTGNEGDLLKNLMTMQNQGGGVAGTNDYLRSVLSGSFLPGQGGGNPFLAAAIEAAQRPTLEGLERTLSRALPGYFTANGHMISPNNKGQGGSSAFDRAAAIATEGAARAVGDIATNISSQNYENERNRQTQAVQLSQQEVQNTVTNLQAQALPRMIQELGIERGLSLFQSNITSLLQLLQSLGGIAAPVVGQQATSQGQSTAQGSGSSVSSGTSSGFSQGDTQQSIFSQLFPKGS